MSLQLPPDDAWRDEIAARRARVAGVVKSRGCDAALVFGCRGFAEQFRYLANFEPLFEGWIVVERAGGAHGITHSLQLWDAENASPLGWVGGRDLVPFVVETLERTDARRVGLVGTDRLPARQLDKIEKALPLVEFTDVEDEIAALRHLKSPLEIAAIRAAAAIADDALEAALRELRPGVTEVQLSARVEYEVRVRGGTCSLPVFVLSGNDNPTGHRDPRDRPIELGETVMVDFVVVINGYHADLARSVVLGTPSALQTQAWEAVAAAHEAALATVGPGRRCSDIQEAAVSTLVRRGYAHPSRIGHGLGLGHSYEWPSLDSDAVLEPGAVFCIEPRINEPGTGLVKIEDDVVVTADGYELLTHARRVFALHPKAAA